MNLLFIGDVVGKSGCEFLKSKIFSIKKEYNIDITIINGENSAQGNGITPASAEELMSCGADVITTGNHAFKRFESDSVFSNDCILRPANYPDGCIGNGFCTLDFGSFSIAVINLLGTVYLDSLDNPFSVIDNILKQIDTPNIFLDFHAEATAEKKAMGHYLTGRITALFGTHTHVQTADEIILGGHTGYITDVGMTGPELSVLGIEPQNAINMMRFKTPVKFNEASSPCFINGIYVNFDQKTGICAEIKRIQVR